MMNKTDMQLKNDVEDELKWDPQIDAAKIHVNAKNGVLSLSGVVDSYAEKWAAEEAAKRVGGVRALADELSVTLPNHHRRNDEALAAAALHALEWNVWIPKSVKAAVSDGRISLSGEVEYNYQRDAAESAMRHLPGVVSVLDAITISPRASATEVQGLLESALQRQATSDAKSITVYASGGMVTLTGHASSWRAIENATKAAWAAPGVMHVDNRIAFTAN